MILKLDFIIVLKNLKIYRSAKLGISSLGCKRVFSLRSERTPHKSVFVGCVRSGAKKTSLHSVWRICHHEECKKLYFRDVV